MLNLLMGLILCTTICAIVGQPATAGSRNCLVDGVVRRNGERFAMRCVGICTCQDAGIGCVSMCPPFGMPPICRRVKKLGRCCDEAHCPRNDQEKAACRTHGQQGSSKSSTPAALPQSLQPPWNIRLSVENGGRTGSCLATILNQTLLSVAPNCCNERSKILYPPSMQNSTIRPKVPQASTGQRQPVIEAEVDPPLEFLTTLHEINLPYRSACQRPDCALFVSAFDPVNKKMSLLTARQSTKEKCNLNPVDVSNEIACLEIISDSHHPVCLNLDGASVVIQDNEIFYFVGYLTDGPFSAKDNRQCDQNQAPYRKYQRLCNRFGLV